MKTTPDDLPAKGIATVRNVDHYGVSVPDMDQAIAFYTQALGADLLWRVGPFHETHTGAEIDQVEIAMLRLGPNLNVELLAIRAPGQNRQVPATTDIGAAHLAFLVDDLEAAGASVAAHGGTMLGQPVNTAGEPKRGERIWYFKTPWGAFIELLWRPGTCPMSRRRRPGCMDPPVHGRTEANPKKQTMSELTDTIDRMNAPALRKKFYVALIFPLASEEEMLPHVPEHLEYMMAHEDQIFLSGPFVKPGHLVDEGLTVFHAENEEQAAEFMRNEPLTKRGQGRQAPSGKQDQSSVVKEILCHTVLEENSQPERTMSKNRVDIHTHLVPPFWAEELKSHGGDPSGWGAPTWSPQLLLEFMDAEEITFSILSLTAPGIEGWQGADRFKIAREINDYGASLVSDQPTRFGYLATLALPDVEAGLAEIHRAFDELGADGIVLHSNFDGIYLGDPLFEPVWEELNRRAAVVFVHPTTSPGVKVLKGQPSPLEDYPADTTKCAVDLVSARVINKFPSTKIVLSHGGGFLPYAATRFAELMASLSPARSVDALLEEMKSFYFDTALTAPSGMPSLLAFAAPGHILFGTDYPYASEKVSKTFTQNLDSYAQRSTGDLAAINNGARHLFPRLKS